MQRQSDRDKKNLSRRKHNQQIGRSGRTRLALPLSIWAVLLVFLNPAGWAQGAQGAGASAGSGAAGNQENRQAQPSGQIREAQLAGLPMNGRSYSQLATLQAGVSDSTATSGPRGVGGGGLTISGGRSTSNTFLLDGTNIMNRDNQVPRSAAGVQLGSDAALQVEVFGTQSGAEYGRSSGGTVNSITRSGTPQFHGTFFEFFRNSKLDARNFFDPESEPVPFKRNQFGFTLTGPAWKDRTFFMGNYEGLRDRLSTIEADFFPDDLARQGIITDRDGNVLRKVAVHPEVKRYLELFPRPNSVRVGGGVMENLGANHLPTDEDFFTARVDHQISSRDSFFVRYNLDNATGHEAQNTFLFATRSKTRQHYLTLVESHIFSPSTVNAFRLGYTRLTARDETVVKGIDIPRSFFFVPDAPQFGQLSVPTLSPFGPEPRMPQADTTNTFQFANDLLLQRGAHALRLGLEIHRYRWDTFSSTNKGAIWSFNSLESFLQGGPDGTTLQVALPGSDNRKAFRQTLLGFYFQDGYTVSTDLQLSLGLRYELATLVHDKDGKTAFLADPMHDSAVKKGPFLAKNPSLRNFSPRLGVSWSPFGNQNLVLRAGFGIYYDQLLEYAIDRKKSAAPFYKRVVRTNFDASGATPSLAFPNAVAAAAGLPFYAEVLDYQNMTNSMVLRYNFAIEQELPGGLQTNISYVGARGNHLYRSYETNLFPIPTTLPNGTLFFPDNCNDLGTPSKPRVPSEFCRPNAGPVNPAFDSVNLMASDAQSFYNSLRVAVAKRIGSGSSLQGSYTFSKSVDDSSSHTGGGEQFGWMRTLERGLSDFDIRQRLVFNYFYTPPFGKGHRWWDSGILAHLFGDWRVGGIVSFRTGTPFTPQVNVRTTGYLFAPTRPNLISGGNKNPIEGVTAGCESVPVGQKLGTRDRYFDPCMFEVPPPGTLGTAGRNTIIAPSIFNIDVSLSKEFSIDAKRRLQLRAEFFNLPNHTNFNPSRGGSIIVFSGASGNRNQRTGRISSTATTARQIQFALRFSF